MSSRVWFPSAAPVPFLRRRAYGPPKLRAVRGFSLMEVMIAAVIFALASMSIITSLIQSSQSTRLNTNAVAAKNVAQGFFERMAIDDFADVGPPPGGNYVNKDYGDPDPVWLDRALGIKCKVEFVFKGYGTLESASATTLTDDEAVWASNEWAGDTVYLVDGHGVGQYAQIDANSATSLNLASALVMVPDSSTKYMVNNGKTIEITTTWRYMAREYRKTIESLIINHRNADDMGF